MIDYVFLNDALEALEQDQSLVGKGVMKDLITIEQFENLLNFTPYTTDKRFKATGNLPEEGYTWTNSAWNSDNCPPASIKKEIMERSVCYMINASRANKQINAVAEFIEDAWGFPTDCHLYFSISPDQVNHFGIHKDKQHNIIAQVDGITHWKVGTKIYTPDDATNLKEFNGDDTLSIDIELHPGDAIVVPAGVYHKPENMTKRISASFPVSPWAKDCEDRTWITW